MILHAKFLHGGVKLRGKKELSKDVPCLPLDPPEKVFIPVRQHIGAPAEPVVSVGQKVARGELIAKSDAPLSARVHASVAGVVERIEDM